jgi:glycosyltransferase involved in cell wall biosynthesis
MTTQIIEQVGKEGLSGHVIFAGALWEEDRDRMYQSADLVVMPSVSEPFGLVPLEAIQHGTPSLISKQSGVAEVLSHTLKVDFWDIDEMANQILSVLRYDVLHTQLRTQGREEINNLSWREAATKVLHLYRRMIHYI